PDVGLHSGYSFPLLEARKLGPEFIRAHFAMLAKYPAHWPSVAFCNHDIMRTLTRFGGPDAPPALARLMLALLLSLKGTTLVYQGEELGLPEADLTRRQLRDPVGDLYYPFSKGRDGCRTPMPWNGDAHSLGFTTGTPWLPMAPAHRALAVSAQEQDKTSTLAFVRRFLAARKASAALRLGQIEFHDAPSPVLAFVRKTAKETMLCVFNMSKEPAEFRDPVLARATPLAIGSGEASVAAGTLSLAAYAAWFARV
ncbi:MAG: alpha-amylase family glycosyl hydrolase, partial [Rhizomicrobium sp.]